ncbi:pyruvate formate-lyase activating enzyme homolog [Pyrobaculum aerophilum str. IM2]|uniref:Pyruvate formate-lyase activating enzyme homolog n=2 Tax=Pyrobaculum aerophilum TaxID=13773 RepID=Q8ZVN9_PYRAE|nr:radical SAM protein [Pyrobaculum aerophilum]AAL64017.1 pyruvate formate-lyase activating enzyme homolog [Pyrobaculum aerophilum str. IM2]HII47216.1 radical SAM protein [Pyrobaculum aerophilum]
MSWIIYRPDAVAIWQEPVVRERLRWYYSVMRDTAPAKFHIAARVEAPHDYASMDDSSLWKLHDELGRAFDEEWRRQKERPDISLTRRELPKASFLDVKIELAKRQLKRCMLCERRCGVDRYSKKGACLLDAKPRVASFFHHLGEEAPLVPSGTVFFSGCNFRCVYCQNWDISQFSESGIEVTAEALAAIQAKLREEGARNINWVGGEPTPNIPYILESLRILARRGVNVPQLWNSNMYLTPEGLALILHVIDIWLPDFKYGNDAHALRYSVAPRCWEVTTRNFSVICKRREDIIVRHLVLPGHVECCTKPVLRWLAENCNHALVNIMDQYRPEYLVEKLNRYREIKRRVSEEEMEEAYRYADSLGLTWREITR